MVLRDKVYRMVRIGALVTGLVIVQQLIARILFGLAFDWTVVPQLALANIGIVFAWFYLMKPDKKIPVFVTLIAAFCLALWLRAVLLYIGAFRFIAPLVVSFVERQIALVWSFIAMPQFIPAALAAVILLLLLPRAKAVYRKVSTSGFFIIPGIK